MVKNPPAVQEPKEKRVQSLSQEYPLEVGMATYSSILAQRSHGQRNLADYSLWGCKESDMTEQLAMHTGLLINLLLVGF